MVNGDCFVGWSSVCVDAAALALSVQEMPRGGLCRLRRNIHPRPRHTCARDTMLSIVRETRATRLLARPGALRDYVHRSGGIGNAARQGGVDRERFSDLVYGDAVLHGERDGCDELRGVGRHDDATDHGT